MKRPPAAKLATISEKFALELGGELPGLEICYETWGELNDLRTNGILVIPAFSANCHARSSEADSSKGWWEHVIGPGLPIDTNRFFVVCPSLLGGCHGTTGPISDEPGAGSPYRGRFPMVTIGDLARCHLRLLKFLAIDRAYAVCGGSMGAMQALEIGIHHSSSTKRVVAISGTDQTRPATAAIRHLGRQAIMLDPHFSAGDYDQHAPEMGIQLAREIGTVFYRSKREFNERFPWEPIATPSLTDTTFDVQSYLAHQGGKMVGKFDANSYLRLSMAMDLHHISRHAPDADWQLDSKGAKFFVAGVQEDRLMPLDEQETLHRALITGGAESQLSVFSSPVGHDAFLVSHDGIGNFIRNSLVDSEASD